MEDDEIAATQPASIASDDSDIRMAFDFLSAASSCLSGDDGSAETSDDSKKGGMKKGTKKDGMKTDKTGGSDKMKSAKKSKKKGTKKNGMKKDKDSMDKMKKMKKSG